MKFGRIIVLTLGVVGMLSLAAAANAKTSDRVVNSDGQSVRQASDVVVASNGSNRSRPCRGAVCR